MRMIISPLLRQALSFAQQEFYVVVLNFFIYFYACGCFMHMQKNTYFYAYACVCLYTMYMHYLQRPGEGTWSPASEVVSCQ